MEGIGTGSTAWHHKVPQPWQTDAHGPTHPTQRDALAGQAFNHRMLRFRNAMVFGRGATLACASFAVMILRAVAGMAIVLVPLCSTGWAYLSDAHGFHWPPAWRTVFKPRPNSRYASAEFHRLTVAAPN